MAFQLHEQYLDIAAGFHVLELRDEHGNKHIAQIAIGHDSCVACGHVRPKDNLDEIDPRAMVAEVLEMLNRSHENMRAYAAKHGVSIK